ncbi:MAG: TMEM175 family protein [Blastocatellia bacterium]
MNKNETGRVEAFSDGVFAIAITLLILEIKVPHVGEMAGSIDLLRGLARLWPSFFAYALSFFVLLVMWINHHELFRFIRTVDYPLLFTNGFLLLLMTFVPFPTAVLAEYLNTPSAREAVAFYNATFFITSIAYNLLFAAAATRRRLIRPEVSDASLRRVKRAYLFGGIIYAASVAVAFWNAIAGLALSSALWILWTRLCYAAKESKP